MSSPVNNKLFCLRCNEPFEKVKNSKFCSIKCRLSNESRLCTICLKKIPSSVLIDGKKRNLQRRTKCLNCAPFLSKKLLTEEERTQNNIEKCKSYYESNKIEMNKVSSKRIKDLRINKKQSIIDIIGGCQICGYNRISRNISFHHLKNKLFNISGNVFAHSVEKLTSELIKCVCLCHMCHGEAHDGLIDESILIDLNIKFIEAVKIWATKT